MGHHKAEHNPKAEELKVGKESSNPRTGKISEGAKRERSRPEQVLHRLEALVAAGQDSVKELRQGGKSAFGQIKGSLEKVAARFGSALQEQ